MHATSPLLSPAIKTGPPVAQGTCRAGRWLVALLPLLLPLLSSGCSSRKPPPTLPPARVAATKVAAQAAILAQTENWPAAAARWSAAADRYRLLNDLPQLAVALHNLGWAQAHLDQPDAARTNLERAAQINKSLQLSGEWWRNQIALLQLDAANSQQGSLQARLTELEPRIEQLRDPSLRGSFFNELGLWQTAQGNFDQAVENFRRAEDQFKTTRDLVGVATVEANRAQLSEARKDWPQAINQWQVALTSFEKLAYPRGITHALAGQGRSLLAAGNDLATAADLLERAAENYRSLGLAKEQRATLKLLEQALRAQGNTAAAEDIATKLK